MNASGVSQVHFGDALASRSSLSSSPLVDVVRGTESFAYRLLRELRPFFAPFRPSPQGQLPAFCTHQCPQALRCVDNHSHVLSPWLRTTGGTILVDAEPLMAPPEPGLNTLIDPPLKLPKASLTKIDPPAYARVKSVVRPNPGHPDAVNPDFYCLAVIVVALLAELDSPVVIQQTRTAPGLPQCFVESFVESVVGLLVVDPEQALTGN